MAARFHSADPFGRPFGEGLLDMFDVSGV